MKGQTSRSYLFVAKAERIAKRSWEFMVELASEGMDEVEGLLESLKKDPVQPSITQLQKRLDKLEGLLLKLREKRQTVSCTKMLVANNAGAKIKP